MLTALPPSAVVSDSVCIADLDLTTITTSDSQFSPQFLYENRCIVKTGSGQTSGKLTKKGTFDDGGSGGLTEIVSQVCNALLLFNFL